MILLVDIVDQLPPSASKRDIEASARAAQWAGFELCYIEPDFSRCGDAKGALAHFPQCSPQSAFWLGYIPSSQRYRDIFVACEDKGLNLPNTPEQHNRGMELDLAYPHLQGITPGTATASSPEQATEAAKELTFPLFVKGSVQSLKSQGWKACVAENSSDLETIVQRLYRSSDRTRGKVILRELLELRHQRVSGNGFPIGREYRVFLYQGQILTISYYWDCEDAFGELSEVDRHEVKTLALDAAHRLEIPYAAIDIGQDVSGRWWVIETADAQFAGLSASTVPGHWHRLAQAAS